MSEPGAPSAPAGIRVFLSYARPDRKRLEPLVQVPEERGYRVWWDQRIGGGAVFSEEIGRALDDAEAVVVAWSKDSISSHWVRDEAERARDLGHLIPLLLDPVSPPLGFRQVQAIDFSAWRGRPGSPEVASLTETLHALAQRPPYPLASSSASRVTRRWPLAAAAAGVAVTTAGVGAAVFWRRMGGAPPPRSVAVAPFANLSGDPRQAFFSDGLADEIRSRLAQNPLLQVMGEMSSKAFTRQNVDEMQLARSLAVSYVLSGSVRMSGDVLRIGTELIESRKGFTLWSTTFDRRLDDVFAIQGEIAAKVSDAMAAHLSGAVGGGPGAGPSPPTAIGDTQNVEAYEAYLRGRSLERLDQGEAPTRAALGEFDKAIALDAKYAAAFAARARMLSALAFSYAEPSALAGLYAAATEAARHAAALQPNLADAQSTLGNILFYGRLDGAAARAPFARAFELGRNDAPTLSRFAGFSAKIGRFDAAQDAVNAALRLDPLNPLIHRTAGIVLCAARRFEEALAPLRQSLALNPKISAANAQIGLALMALSRLEDSRTAIDQEPVAPFRLAALAVLSERRGDHDAARSSLSQLVKSFGDGALYQQAQVQAQMGASDAALTLLERGRASLDAGLTGMGTDVLLDPIRTSPRFTRLSASIGLTG